MSMGRRKDGIKSVNSWDILYYVKNEISPFLAHALQGVGSVKLRRLDRNASLRSSSSNADPILQKLTPYPCLLGASSHGAGCSVKFPTIQKNINHLVWSLLSTTLHHMTPASAGGRGMSQSSENLSVLESSPPRA